VNNELKRMGKEAVMVSFKVLSIIFVEVWRKTVFYIVQDSQCWG
jgi:hypothetical protein